MESLQQMEGSKKPEPPQEKTGATETDAAKIKTSPPEERNEQDQEEGRMKNGELGGNFTNENTSA